MQNRLHVAVAQVTEKIIEYYKHLTLETTASFKKADPGIRDIEIAIHLGNIEKDVDPLIKLENLPSDLQKLLKKYKAAAVLCQILGIQLFAQKTESLLSLYSQNTTPVKQESLDESGQNKIAAQKLLNIKAALNSEFGQTKQLLKEVLSESRSFNFFKDSEGKKFVADIESVIQGVKMEIGNYDIPAFSNITDNLNNRPVPADVTFVYKAL